jgi:hypothetical protein
MVRLDIDSLDPKLNKYYKRKINEDKPIYDLSDKVVYNEVTKIISHILTLNEPQKNKWNFEENLLQTRLLLAWFCKSKELFEETAKGIGDKTLSMSKNLYLCGVKGSGKSSTVSALNEFMVKFTDQGIKTKDRVFKYVEQNKMANTYEIESNINKYTYNEVPGKFEGSPINIILDDLKFTGLTKSFGTDFIDIIIRFLYDRYSIWLFGGANTIITSLLTPVELRDKLPPDLYNRFQHQYNIITFKGTQRGV